MKYFLLVLIVLLLFPLYWMFSGSLQPSVGLLRIPPNWIPRHITFSNYAELIRETMVLRWTINTIVLNTITLGIQLFCIVMASYAFTVYRFRGRRVIFWVFVASIIIPWQALLVSRYVLLRHLYLLNTWFSVIFIGAFNPVGIVLFKNYFEKIPKAIYDSARVDGAREMRILFQIILPQCKPILGFLAISSYLAAFQDFLWPMLVLNNAQLYTLPLGIVQYLKTYTFLHDGLALRRLLGLELAGGVLLFLPAILIFVVFQKTFRQQFLAGGIKE